jgi:phosphohistidine swiveling domain-containing protein
MSKEWKKDSSDLKGTRWIHDWSRNYGVLYSEVLMDEMERSPYSMFPPDSHIIYPDNRNAGHFVKEDKWHTHVPDIKDIIADEEDLDRQMEGCEKVGQEYLETAKKASAMELGKLSDAELLKLFDEYWDVWVRYTSYVWTLFHVNELLNPETEKFLDSKAKDFDSTDDFGRFVNYVASPTKKSSILKLNEELLEIKRNHSEEKLQEICERYVWVPCLDLHHPPWDVKHLRDYYDTHTFSDAPLPDDSIMDSIKLDEAELRLVRISKKMAYAKDFRDEYRRRGVYRSRFLLGEIGRRMGIDPELVSFVSSKEIRDFLTTGQAPPKEIVAERADGFMMFREDGKLVVATGKDMERYASQLGFQKDEGMDKEVKGTIGSKGKVTGKVKIVLVEEDLAKIDPGDVLVALTTNPTYTPAMAKAMAFVTDQGGITCHAAIVAREMGKPCIVGTKNATKVLKEGEMVEVDAEKGIVRKLKE